MMMAPATMLSFNGQVHFEFDDFEEVQSHPMAEAGMMTLGQLVEGALGQGIGDFDPNSVSTDVPSTDGKEGADKEAIEIMEIVGKMLAGTSDILGNMKDTFSVKVGLPQVGSAIEVNVNAPGAYRLVKIPLTMVKQGFAEEVGYMCDDE